ncbi:ABC transporter substrate-binding protein [Streptomyces andamanensis]|uniref:ABC transporter substrate-binding protein n=1 Tax=Streptomyces andamanensis TaxID=1565035 RepID=A0ABV8TJ73_9ACTN
MEPLLPSDPARLGGHRLLGRLGAGGMGVVYLARADSGELAAVKVIRSEYAGEAEFRARFRREVAAARRVAGPWVARLTGADTGAREPWLATAFVPGPSLAEAVAAAGPLPGAAVRVLGRALARALDAVHGAGLVHRDVKPGNVLLALDGPRLIDFGIARSVSAEATALTSDSVIVGTPGFLSPEQARAGQVSTASDVFSLGCVLAYAATGRPPFGGGAADALLYRTVHDRPDLDGVPDDDGLRALLERCLAKEPGDRPTAAGVAERLTPDGRAPEAAEDPAGAPDGSADWLPEPVVAMIADRSARMLALPAVEPTEAGPGAVRQPDPGPPSAAGPPHASRRRLLALTAVGALVAAGGGTALWAALRGGGHGGAPAARRWVIGVQADLSGPQRTAGRAQEQGVRLAVEQFNSRPDRPFTLTVRTEDDGGLASRARAAGLRLTGDRDVFAVVGPTGFTSTAAALASYENTGTPLLTVSELCLSSVGSALVTDPRAYFRCAPPTMAGAFMTDARLAASGVRRPGLLMDRAGRLTGREAVQMAYGTAARFKLSPYIRIVPAAAPDPSVVLADMLGHGVDALYYSGTAERAASVARALAGRGFGGPRFLDGPAAADGFPAAAGAAADGWQALTSFTSPGIPAVRSFTTAFRARYGGAPGVWAVEAYDAARLLIDRLTALHRAHGGRPSRARLLAAVRAADFKGVAATYAFEKDGTFKGGRLSHLRVTGGRWRYVGPVDLA